MTWTAGAARVKEDSGLTGDASVLVPLPFVVGVRQGIDESWRLWLPGRTFVLRERFWTVCGF